MIRFSKLAVCCILVCFSLISYTKIEKSGSLSNWKISHHNFTKQTKGKFAHNKVNKNIEHEEADDQYIPDIDSMDCQHYFIDGRSAVNIVPINVFQRSFD